ncbi:MAG: hypothetical protein AAB702_02685 [Patescibacteria group bacterium]
MNKESSVKDLRIDPKVKEVLKLLGAGVILTAAIIMPGSAILIKEYAKIKKEKDEKEWKKFNAWRLKQVIKRLQNQKDIEIAGGYVRITDKGKKKLLKFNLEEISLKEKRDGKWRIIIYDISNLKRLQRDIFRDTLKRLKFYRLQESVYLTPFICEDEIEYLRQTFQIGNEVQILKVSKLENEKAYKEYFGI